MPYAILNQYWTAILIFDPGNLWTNIKQLSGLVFALVNIMFSLLFMDIRIDRKRDKNTGRR